MDKIDVHTNSVYDKTIAPLCFLGRLIVRIIS